ncbi:hypothetical protein K0M31_010489, partial [Melipona bicolor]
MAYNLVARLQVKRLGKVSSFVAVAERWGVIKFQQFPCVSQDAEDSFKFTERL